MIFFKITGACLLVGSGIMLSRSLNRHAELSLQRAEAWATLLGTIKNEIECFSLPIADILLRIDRELFLSCGYMGDTPPKTLRALADGTKWADKETRRSIYRFISEFGRSYRDEQVGRCAYYQALVEERKKALMSALPSKRRLNSTLCLSGSLCLLILFM